MIRKISVYLLILWWVGDYDKTLVNICWFQFIPLMTIWCSQYSQTHYPENKYGCTVYLMVISKDDLISLKLIKYRWFFRTVR